MCSAPFFFFFFFFFNIWLFYRDVRVSTLVVNSVTWTFPPVQCVFSFAQCCFAVCLHSQTVLMGWTPLEAETLPSSERRWERWSGEAGVWWRRQGSVGKSSTPCLLWRWPSDAEGKTGFPADWPISAGRAVSCPVLMESSSCPLLFT